MAAPPVTEFSLLAYVKRSLRDDENKLFTDDEYTTYLWEARYSCTSNREQATARESDDVAGMYFYTIGCLGYLWQAEVQSPVAGQTYRINEVSGIVFNPEGGDPATELTLKGWRVNPDRAIVKAMLDASTNPAKSAIYLQANGFTVDTRTASDAMHKRALQYAYEHHV